MKKNATSDTHHSRLIVNFKGLSFVQYYYFHFIFHSFSLIVLAYAIDNNK